MASTKVPKLGRCRWQSSSCILLYFCWSSCNPGMIHLPGCLFVIKQLPFMMVSRWICTVRSFLDVPDCVSKRRKELPEKLSEHCNWSLSASSSLFFLPKQLYMSAADNTDTAATTVVDASACCMIVRFLLLHQRHYRCYSCRIRCQVVWIVVSRRPILLARL